MSIFLRAATVDDADSVMRLHMRCHEETYGAHLPSEFFDLRRKTLLGRIDNFRNAIGAGHIPTIAYDDDGLVGVAAAGGTDDPEAPVSLELRMIYTLKRVHGQGAGQLMLDAVIGQSAAFLWVRGDVCGASTTLAG